MAGDSGSSRPPAVLLVLPTIASGAAEARVDHAHARAAGVCHLGAKAARELLGRLAALGAVVAGSRGLAEGAKGMQGGTVAREHRGEAAVLEQRLLHRCDRDMMKRARRKRTRAPVKGRRENNAIPKKSERSSTKRYG